MAQISIENISFDSKVELFPLKKLAQKLLRDFKEKGGVNIILVSDNYMQDLNQRFTRRKGSTDVLAFSFKEHSSQRGKKNYFLGEVYISVDKARIQAKSSRVPFKEELRRLIAHGLLHLFGYEHKNKKDEEKMRKKEEEYIFSKRI